MRAVAVRIPRQLGQGGMGVVYSAYDAELDRKVAGKVVRDTLKDSSQGRTRVLQEAQAMARIAHPNVVHVYEAGQDTSAAAYLRPWSTHSSAGESAPKR